MSTSMNHNCCQFETISYMAGAIILMTLVLSFTFSAIIMLAGFSQCAWTFPLSLILSTGYIFSVDVGIKIRIQAIAAVVGCIGLSIVMCAWFEDPSYDGNTYHQETIARILSKWNPYWMIDDLPSDMSPWTRHYAKGLEIISSSIAAFTGSIESGKAVNLMLMSATAFLLHPFLRWLIPGISLRSNIILIIALVANPVAMSQMLTFYIDYSKYFYILLSIILSCRLTVSQNRVGSMCDSLLLSGVILLAIATKFNIFFEEGICMFAIIVWQLICGRIRGVRRVCACGISALLVGVLLCFHPYVTNYITSGHPLYPLMGNCSVDIMTKNTPELFSHGRIINFFLSYLTPTIPTYAARVNGFGFVTTILLILSVVVFVRSHRYVPVWMWYGLVVTLVSCFMYDQLWWARYVCQLWLVPCMAFMVTLIYAPHNNVWMRRAFSSMILLGAILSFSSTLYISARLTVVRQFLYEMGRLRKIEVSYTAPSLERHFSEYGIEVTTVSTETFSRCEKTGQISYYGEIGDAAYFPTIIATPSEIDAFTEWGRNFGFDVIKMSSK